jgi:hypothetical protein
MGRSRSSPTTTTARAAALQAWNANAPEEDTLLAASARPLLASSDFMAGGARRRRWRAPRTRPTPALTAMFRRAQTDSATDALPRPLDALLAISKGTSPGSAAVQADLLKAVPRQTTCCGRGRRITGRRSRHSGGRCH